MLALPDPRKGERLVLLTEAPAPSRSQFTRFAPWRGAGDLMVPAEIVSVERRPLLGTSKLDHTALPALLASVSAKATATADPVQEPA